MWARYLPPGRVQDAVLLQNGQGDECLFIHHGSGECRTMFGTLKFGPKDYIVIPKGTIYQIEFDPLADEDRPNGVSEDEMPFGKFLVIETCNASHIARRPATSRRKRRSSSSTPPTASVTCVCPRCP